MSARVDRLVERRAAAALVTALVALAPAACNQADAVSTEHYQPSKVTAATDGGHPVVTLTELGARRIGLKTEAVKKREGGTSIPYASLLYDADNGQPYVFVNTEKLNFHRTDVKVENIDDDTVNLSAGPPVGTRVVTVGLPQVHGAELEFGAY